MAESSTRRKLLKGRTLSLVVLLNLGVGLTAIPYAAAAGEGEGVATGTENQIDSGDPPITGTIDAVGSTPLPLCARAYDGAYDGTLDGVSASYTLTAADGTFTPGSGVQDTGPVTIDVTSDAQFHFGPQGTHFGTSSQGKDCGASNLGPLSPVPATITVSGSSFSCSGTGGFWRAAGNAFGVDVALSSCTVGTLPAANNVTFAGNFQPPCGGPLPVDCITGAYVQH